MITVLGPTASGRPRLPFNCHARCRNGSADSGRCISKWILDGKDLSDYTVGGTAIPYHLIDTREPGEKYTLFDYQHDFHEAFQEISGRGKRTILCGGTGLYIESVLKGYHLPDVPPNPQLRAELEGRSLAEQAICLAVTARYNTTDTENKKRAIRAIELKCSRPNRRALPPWIPHRAPSWGWTSTGVATKEDANPVARATERRNDRGGRQILDTGFHG